MKKKKSTKKMVMCPFYADNRNRLFILCEGEEGVEAGDFHVNNFDSNEETREHFEKYCCKTWKECARAKELNKKYGL